MITLRSLQKKKRDKEKITALALYDASLAGIAARTGIDILLVGDSLGMVIQGHPSTLRVTVEHMVYHTSCVSTNSHDAFIITDLPFASYSNSEQTLASAAGVMRAGAHMVKLEGGAWLQPRIQELVNTGIPVCGHLGLTPQSVNILGGFLVQGITPEAADTLVQEAIELERAGVAMLVLECIPTQLARIITNELTIPTIGIGAGVETDGQVLVAYDMLGITSDKQPRFVKNFLNQSDSIEQAIASYVEEVRQVRFPAPEHGYD